MRNRSIASGHQRWWLMVALFVLISASPAPAQTQSQPSVDLLYFAGKWEGGSLDNGDMKGVANYEWSDERSSLEIDMSFTEGNRSAGSAYGFLSTDPATGELQQAIVMDDGTVVRMKEIDRDDSQITLAAEASSDAMFGGEFRVVYEMIAFNQFESVVFVEQGGDWVEVSRNRYEKVRG